jgi:heme exporter protein D
MRNLDFSSWQAVITTLLGLVVATIMMVGIRLLVMETVQQRRNRENRQINERLRTLIAAYKTLGGSFTGELAVDPTHLRDLLASAGGGDTEAGEDISASVSFDRSRRIRDAVEGALSDVILLGTEQQVLLAARAATDLVAGRPVHTDELVVSLRDFIRKVLDLEPVPTKLAIPKQGPTRPGGGGGGKGKGDTGGGDRAGTKQDGKGAGAGGGSAAGGAMGLGLGGGLAQDAEGDPGREAESSP